MKNCLYIFITALSLSLAGCNTVNGVGKDLKSAGDAISHGANEVQQKL